MGAATEADARFFYYSLDLLILARHFSPLPGSSPSENTRQHPQTAHRNRAQSWGRL